MNNAQTATIIKHLCKVKSISVSSLLLNCEIRKSLIYDMEKRDFTPSGEILHRIADYLDCSVDYLLGRTDVPEVNYGTQPFEELKAVEYGIKGTHPGIDIPIDDEDDDTPII